MFAWVYVVCVFGLLFCLELCWLCLCFVLIGCRHPYSKQHHLYVVCLFVCVYMFLYLCVCCVYVYCVDWFCACKSEIKTFSANLALWRIKPIERYVAFFAQFTVYEQAF